MSYNHFVVIGRLARDPELKYTEKGLAICKICIVWDDGYGDEKESCYMDATAFNKTAEFIGQWFKKGREILVDGRIKQEKWEKDGVKHSKHSITVNTVKFAGGKRNADETQQEAASVTVDAVSSDIPF